MMNNQTHKILDALNGAYLFCVTANTEAGKEAAERTFYDCHDWLRKHRIKFHLASAQRQWVMDYG